MYTYILQGLKLLDHACTCFLVASLEKGPSSTEGTRHLPKQFSPVFSIHVRSNHLLQSLYLLAWCRDEGMKGKRSSMFFLSCISYVATMIRSLIDS